MTAEKLQERRAIALANLAHARARIVEAESERARRRHARRIENAKADLGAIAYLHSRFFGGEGEAAPAFA